MLLICEQMTQLGQGSTCFQWQQLVCHIYTLLRVSGSQQFYTQGLYFQVVDNQLICITAVPETFQLLAIKYQIDTTSVCHMKMLQGSHVVHRLQIWETVVQRLTVYNDTLANAPFMFIYSGLQGNVASSKHYVASSLCGPVFEPYLLIGARLELLLEECKFAGCVLESEDSFDMSNGI